MKKLRQKRLMCHIHTDSKWSNWNFNSGCLAFNHYAILLNEERWRGGEIEIRWLDDLQNKE